MAAMALSHVCRVKERILDLIVNESTIHDGLHVLHLGLYNACNVPCTPQASPHSSHQAQYLIVGIQFFQGGVFAYCDRSVGLSAARFVLRQNGARWAYNLQKSIGMWGRHFD